MPPFFLPKSTIILPKIDPKMHQIFYPFQHRFFIDFGPIWEANLEPCWPPFRSKIALGPSWAPLGGGSRRRPRRPQEVPGPPGGPRGSQDVPGPPKRFPGGPRAPPRGSQKVPKRRPRGPNKHPTGPKRFPKVAQEAPKSAQEASCVANMTLLGAVFVPSVGGGSRGLLKVRAPHLGDAIQARRNARSG